MKNNNSFSFVAFTNHGCNSICLNMIRSLLSVCPDSKITLYCTDNKSFEFFNACNLPILTVNYKPSNHSTEEYVDYRSKNWNSITGEKYKILLDFMKTSGEQFFFYADCDLYFVKSPLKEFEKLMSQENIHLVMQTDKPLGHKYCTGAILVRNSSYSQEIFETCIKNMSGDDQDTMNALFAIDSPESSKICNFSDEFCTNGYLFFKSGQITDSTIVHANFFVGMDQKINALKTKEMWLI